MSIRGLFICFVKEERVYEIEIMNHKGQRKNSLGFLVLLEPSKWFFSNRVFSDFVLVNMFISEFYINEAYIS